MTNEPNDPTTADVEFDPYYDQLYRYQIAAALNSVIRTCRDITRHHSAYGFWTPSTAEEDPTHQDLIHTARQDMTALQFAITAAEKVLTAIEADRTKPTRHRPPTE